MRRQEGGSGQRGQGGAYTRGREGPGECHYRGGGTCLGWIMMVFPSRLTMMTGTRQHDELVRSI